MKKTTFSVLVLVAALILSGIISNPALAQNDPTILLTIAKNAEDQIRINLSDNSSNTVKKLFEEGSNHVISLSHAIDENNSELAKNHFLSAMRIFKEISKLTADTYSTTISKEEKSSTAEINPTSDLVKLYRYTSSLKSITEKNHLTVDFSKINNQFETARNQIISKQFVEAQKTIIEIKESLYEIEKLLHDQTSQQESERANKYAQKYLEQLDRLIKGAKNQGVSDNIINKLEDAREQLSQATTTQEIIKEIRNIISLKNQFDLTINDSLELKILSVEKKLFKLSQIEKIEPQIIEDAKIDLEQIKLFLSQGEFDQANKHLKNLVNQINAIIQSNKLS